MCADPSYKEHETLSRNDASNGLKFGLARLVSGAHSQSPKPPARDFTPWLRSFQLESEVRKALCKGGDKGVSEN